MVFSNWEYDKIQAFVALVESQTEEGNEPRELWDAIDEMNRRDDDAGIYPRPEHRAEKVSA
jgi:hypothetical protein